MTTECAANVARDINIYMIDLHRTTSEERQMRPERNRDASSFAGRLFPPSSRERYTGTLGGFSAQRMKMVDAI